MYIFSSSIKVDDSSTFKLYCEFSRSEVIEKIRKAETEIALIILLVFVVSFIILFAASFILLIPIQKISRSSYEIASGNLSKRIPNKTHNEFSQLAISINSLAADLQNANLQIEKLNKELKFQFRDKIGELNYEINKKRRAESLLKQSEEQFRLLFELAPIGMVISSINGKIIKVNKAFYSVLGYTEEEILEMKIKDLTHRDDLKFDKDLQDKMIDGIETSVYYEKRLVRKDGGIMYAIVEAALVRDKAGQPSHFIKQIIDITERKRVEKELIFAKEKAEESDRLKSAFLAQMSHEIRTPLNVILTAMNLIQDELDDTDEDTMNILESVSSAGKRLQRTIDLILSISAVQSESYSPELKVFNLDSELKILVDEFRTIESEKEIAISYLSNIRDTLILADHYSVMQIFQNLIGNAVKYTLKGNVTVTLTDWDKEKLQVIVRDTGIGISKDYISNLFSPFSQEDVGHKREFEGNGLGLALVKKYVEINSAEIIVESEKGRGSTFIVIFNKNRSKTTQQKDAFSKKLDGVKKLV
jgi:PAS domain S-box-containing protein